MLTTDYSYDMSLQGSIKSAWTVEDCFRGRDFDFTKPFLPERIAGVGLIDCLDPDEKRMLNQIRAHSYCHIFAFVEEYIVPMVMDRAAPTSMATRPGCGHCCASPKKRSSTSRCFAEPANRSRPGSVSPAIWCPDAKPWPGPYLVPRRSALCC